MSDAATRAMTRKVRSAFELYMVTQEGASPGDALRAFDAWHDQIALKPSEEKTHAT